MGSIVQEDDPRSQAIMAELNAPLETAYGEVVRPRPTKRESYEAELNYTHRANPDDDIHNTLPIDESGQLRYYGKSAGFYMLKDNKQFQNKRVFQFTSKSPNHQPFLVDPFEMPPNDLSEHLLDLYFTHFYSFLPILHKTSFLSTLQNHTTPPLLLNAIYAVASRVSPDERVRADPSKPETAGDVFFERARLLLDLEWDSFKIYTVQSLLLMSSHQNGALKTTRAWIYSGMVSCIYTYYVLFY